MPRARLPLANTIERKVKAVEDYLAVEGVFTRTEFCRQRGLNRTTHQTWQRELERMRRSINDDGRGKKLTVGGSGRVPLTRPVEDALLQWVKDQRREERAISRELIVAECMILLPNLLSTKTPEARLEWCARFMKRHNLSIRRITYSGRKKTPELIQLRDAFAITITTALLSHFVSTAVRAL